MAVTFKGIELIEEGKYVRLKITGKLEKEDYDFFVPEIERQIKQYGKLSMLLKLDDFPPVCLGCFLDAVAVARGQSLFVRDARAVEHECMALNAQIDERVVDPLGHAFGHARCEHHVGLVADRAQVLQPSRDRSAVLSRVLAEDVGPVDPTDRVAR